METIWKKPENDDGYSSSSSSSIGNDSDQDQEDDHNGSFNSAVVALEQALPIRRGISNYYNGNSKSFTRLADSSTSAIQDIGKPDNAYTRRRRNLVALRIKTRKISKKTKTATSSFTRHTTTTQSQINIPLPLRSFSVVKLHQCNSANNGNC